jgi:hypothetical protein
MKTFKDFHLYLGQPVKVWFADEHGRMTIECEGRLSWNHEEDTEWIIYSPLPTDELDAFEDTDFEFKLLLRPLSDMTEEEAKCWYDFRGRYQITNPKCAIENVYRGLYSEGHNGMQVAELTRHLLSKGFDIFDLIPAGLAIDRTKHKATV